MQELSLTSIINGEKEADPAVLVPTILIEILQPKDDIKPNMTPLT